jgi:S-adenosylmethionine hydrolase
VLEVRRIENPDLLARPLSPTFHGRDVFAPTVARLAAGLDFSLVGPRAGSIRRLHIPEAWSTDEGTAGEVLAFDGFGNAITSIRAGRIAGQPRAARVGTREIPFATTYTDLSRGEALCLLGSGGRVEIAVREGSARERLQLVRGTEVLLLEGPA